MKKLIVLIFLLVICSAQSAYAQTTGEQLMGAGMPAAQASLLNTTRNTTFGGTVAVTGATTLTGAAALNGGATVADANTLKLDVGTVAAAGTDNTDATAIVDQLTYVTAADDTKGVILPASTGSGTLYIIHNPAAANLVKVYPDASGQINGGTATTGDVSVAAEETAFFIDVATNVYYGGVAVDF